MKRPLLVTLFFSALLLMLLGVGLLGANTVLARFIPSKDIDSPDAYDKQFMSAGDDVKLRDALKPLLAKTMSPEDKVLVILSWVMNEIPTIGNGSAPSSWKLLEVGRSKGLICGQMADIFRETLIAHGIPARRVILERRVFDKEDAHVTVEAWVNGAWRLYDPTFHIALVADGQRIGAFEARDRWFKRGRAKPEIEFLGEVRYPARVPTYYIRYEVLFRHAFVETARGPGVYRALPIAGIWLAPQWLYVSDATIGTVEENVYSFFYYATFVLLPGFLIAVLGAFLWKRLRPHAHLARRNQR